MSMRVPTTQPSIRAMTPSSAFTSPYAERIISRIGQPEIIRAQIATTMPRRKEANLPSTHCQRNSPLVKYRAYERARKYAYDGQRAGAGRIPTDPWPYGIPSGIAVPAYPCRGTQDRRRMPRGGEKPNITWAATATVAIMMPAVTALILIFFILSFRYLPRSFFSMPFSTLGV